MMEFLKPHKILVTQQFCNYARKFVEKLDWNPINGDSLLFEWYLKKRGYVQKELNWRHDFIYNDMFIDVKEIRTKNFNIDKLKGPQRKLDQFRESIVTGYLTHFLFYHTDKDHDRLLKPGDVVNVEPICLTPARPTIKAVIPSDKKGCEGFVTLEILKILGDTYETITENSC